MVVGYEVRIFKRPIPPANESPMAAIPRTFGFPPGGPGGPLP